jgi:hypothetical protein
MEVLGTEDECTSEYKNRHADQVDLASAWAKKMGPAATRTRGLSQMCLDRLDALP